MVDDGGGSDDGGVDEEADDDDDVTLDCERGCCDDEDVRWICRRVRTTSWGYVVREATIFDSAEQRRMM